MRYVAGLCFLALSLSFSAQVAFEELDFEMDSTRSTFRPSGKNYAFIRSKRGTSGVNRTTRADSILNLPVTEIVLVFTESGPEDLEEREDANRERWENLILTYPEFFQFSTTYKNVCQCNYSGDQDAFKQAQGFYVYFTPEDKPAAVATKAPEKKAESAPPPPPAAAKENPPQQKVPEPTKQEPAAAPPAQAEAPAPVAEKPKAAEPAKTEVAGNDEGEEPAARETPKPRPKTAAAKPKVRKARDPKACRPPCYDGGDEGLNNYFVQGIKLSKKQRRKAKHAVCNVKLQLAQDGSIKKAMVSGDNSAINEQVQAAVNAMSAWLPAVKNGVAVRSEVRITLKYDRETKGMKPSEVAINPRPGPKCKCMSDEEIFGN